MRFGFNLTISDTVSNDSRDYVIKSLSGNQSDPVDEKTYLQEVELMAQYCFCYLDRTDSKELNSVEIQISLQTA
ncbi:MAG: hypothetical protein HOC18_01930 [Candidatus Marinimicrobia bacterium]|jgi:hypothetical protein|nr:hypothetical protein [Candidatus Neomarinimicrobiota bacterium]